MTAKARNNTMPAPARQPDPEPVSTEVTRKTKSLPNIQELGGTGVYIADMTLLKRTAMSIPSVTVNGTDETEFLVALALRAFAPKDHVEAMIASQAVALHHASLECSRRALVPQQSPETTARLRRDAANSARAMIDMCEALDRRRGKAPQVVRVERVVVNEGGQAVVGNVTSGVPLPASAPPLQAIGQAGALTPIAESAEGMVTAAIPSVGRASPLTEGERV